MLNSCWNRIFVSQTAGCSGVITERPGHIGPVSSLLCLRCFILYSRAIPLFFFTCRRPWISSVGCGCVLWLVVKCLVCGRSVGNLVSDRWFYFSLKGISEPFGLRILDAIYPRQNAVELYWGPHDGLPCSYTVWGNVLFLRTFSFVTNLRETTVKNLFVPILRSNMLPPSSGWVNSVLVDI